MGSRPDRMAATLHRRRGRRRGATVAAAVIGLLALARPAVGQDPDLPTVTLTGASGPRTQAFVRCDDSTTGLGRQPGSVTLSRTGSRAGELTVAIGSTGEPVRAADGRTFPTEVTFAAGERSHLVPYLNAPASDPALPSTFTVDADDGYLVGEPSTQSATPTTVTLPKNCHDVERTVSLGATPDPIDLDDYLVEPFGGPLPTIEGAVPPGLRFVTDGRWEGTASTTGTFEFTALACPFGCVELNIRVVVTGGVTTTSEPIVAPGPAPATPVPGSANFTG